MKFLRFIHGRQHINPMPGTSAEAPITGASTKDEELKCLYAEYVSTLAHANAMLQRHGVKSSQFAEADIIGMRLFHRFKKMQGLGKPGKVRD